MDTLRLRYATIVGTCLQVAMTLIGHFVPLVRANFMYGGLTFSLIAGVLYALGAAGGWGSAAAGGAIAGGLCALIGIAVSCLLGDVPAPVLLFGTLGSAVAGLIGALVARALRGGASGRSAS
jgi:hypothetical protein